MKRRPDILYLLLLCLSTGGALRVTVWPSEVSALRGRNVSIACDVLELNLNNPLELAWIRKVRDNSTDVYYYHNGEVKKSTPRYHVTTEEIPRGKAALHISELQFGDEGEYTCAVGNTPEQTEATSTLQVSAPPSVTLTPEDPRIELGTEKSAMCELTGFYPQAITILWVRHHKHSPGYDILQKGKSTTDPEMNSDGTFNITSQLILRPQEVGMDRYSCNVTHRSLEEDIVRSFTLTVTEREDNTGKIVWTVIGTLLVIFLPVAAVLYYLITVKKYSPTVSEIQGKDVLFHTMPELLMIGITNYRPEDITISVCLRRPREQKSEEQNSQEQEETTIYTWRSQDPPTLARVTPARGDPEETVLQHIEEERRLVKGVPQNDPLQLEMFPLISKKRFGIYSCQCVLRITPFDTDNGAELSVHVEHPTMKSPISVRRTLSVKRAVPEIDSIWKHPKAVIAGKHLILSCMIHSFYPSEIHVTWYIEHRGEKKPIESRPREILRKPDNLHYTISRVDFTPTKSDVGKTFWCEVRHETLTTPKSTPWTLSELRE